MALTKRPRVDRAGKSEMSEAEIARRIDQGSGEPAADRKEKRVGVMLRLPQETVAEIDEALSRLPVRPTRHAWLLQAIEEKLEREVGE
jgi:hypothetical protein